MEWARHWYGKYWKGIRNVPMVTHSKQQLRFFFETKYQILILDICPNMMLLKFDVEARLKYKNTFKICHESKQYDFQARQLPVAVFRQS